MKRYLKAEKCRMNGCQNILCYIHWCRDLFDNYTGTLMLGESMFQDLSENINLGMAKERFTILMYNHDNDQTTKPQIKHADRMLLPSSLQKYSQIYLRVHRSWETNHIHHFRLSFIPSGIVLELYRTTAGQNRRSCYVVFRQTGWKGLLRQKWCHSVCEVAQ